MRRDCISHDMQPQGADSSTTETLPAQGCLPPLTLAASYFAGLQNSLELPPSLPCRQALPYDTIHSPDAPSAFGLS